jgi:hypothetical protein
MTANKFNKGDAVRLNSEVLEQGKDIKSRYYILVTISGNKKLIIDKIIKHKTLGEGYLTQNGVYVTDEILEPWSDKLHCLYCGAEIVIQRCNGGDEVYRDEAIHHKQCPLDALIRYFDTEQEALDAYSMKWEG